MFFKNKQNLAVRLRTLKDCSKEGKLSVFYSPSQIDTFLHYKHKVPHSDAESTRVTSDIYMLFNAQRLDRQSRESILQYFDNMVIRQPSLASLKSKLTDDQLISIVKSRYIQAPSELLAYSSYLNSLAESELQAIAEAARAKLDASSSSDSDDSSSSGSAAGSAGGSSE